MSRLPRPTRRGLREASEDAAALAGRSVRRLRRLPAGPAAAILGFLAIVALFVFVPLPGVSCGISPAKECPPTDDAAALAPAGSYAYLHLSLDEESSQVEQAAELTALFPNFDAILQGSFQALGPDLPIDLRGELSRWVGDEVALAAVPGAAGEPEPLLLVAVADPEAATAFLEDLGGLPQREEHRGVEVDAYDPGFAAAQREGFLAIGTDAAVRASIDATAEEDGSLEDSAAAEEFRDLLPERRLADAYVSEDGIAQLLEGRGGVAGQLDTFTDFGSSRGIGFAAVAHSEGLELDVASLLDPERVRVAPGFFAAFPRFRAGLAAEFAPRTLALLALGDPSRTTRMLLDQAEAAVPGIAGAFDRLDTRLAEEAGVGIEDGLLPLLDGEAAIGVTAARPVPYVTAVFDGVDEDRTREAVARLQAPIVAAFDPAETGQAPAFSESRVGDVTVQRVRLSPALELSYAVHDGRLVVSTALAGVEHAVEGGEGLADDEGFRTAASFAPDAVSALLFLDLEGLVELAEPRGLAEIVREFSGDLARLRTIELTVESSEDSLRTQLFLEIR